MKPFHCFVGIFVAAVLPQLCAGDTSKVSTPPEGIFSSLKDQDRQVAIDFYGKYLDVGGLSIVASGEVADDALYRTRGIVSHMLAGRPDVLAHMQKVGTRLIIIGKDQVYTDMPDYRHTRDPAFMNERVRGTGGLRITSFGEENLLNLAIDRYDDESIAVHEFCHTIDAALREIDPAWTARLDAVFKNAISTGRWRDAYALSNAGEYWAEIAQSYLDCNRVNNWNHRNIRTREQLKAYDPEAFALARDTFRFTAENDWRFTPMQTQPSVISPPARFKINSYYAKFTYARELPIIASSEVSDSAMLRANDVVRKMFAYRNDVLKTLINEGAKLVVLSETESLSDLPELRSTATSQPVWDDARLFDYAPDSQVIVVGEENVLRRSNDPLDGAGGIVRLLARAMYTATAHRPHDPAWESRSPRIVQQYEKRVERLDERFGAAIHSLFDSAKTNGLWRGTPAANDPITYWATGVEAYFDAVGNAEPPERSTGSIATREALKQYDPGLFELVEKTFGYQGRVDWRYTKNSPELLLP